MISTISGSRAASSVNQFSRSANGSARASSSSREAAAHCSAVSCEKSVITRIHTRLNQQGGQRCSLFETGEHEQARLIPVTTHRSVGDAECQGIFNLEIPAEITHLDDFSARRVEFLEFQKRTLHVQHRTDVLLHLGNAGGQHHLGGAPSVALSLLAPRKI